MSDYTADLPNAEVFRGDNTTSDKEIALFNQATKNSMGDEEWQTSTDSEDHNREESAVSDVNNEEDSHGKELEPKLPRKKGKIAAKINKKRYWDGQEASSEEDKEVRPPDHHTGGLRV